MLEPGCLIHCALACREPGFERGGLVFRNGQGVDDDVGHGASVRGGGGRCLGVELVGCFGVRLVPELFCQGRSGGCALRCSVGSRRSGKSRPADWGSSGQDGDDQVTCATRTNLTGRDVRFS